MDVTILREALQTAPNHSCEIIVKAISEKLANALGEQVQYIRVFRYIFTIKLTLGLLLSA